MSTDQEEFWKGEFGDNYTDRNVNLVENNFHMFYDIFNWKEEDNDLFGFFKKDDFNNINSIIEFGAGSGQNMGALKRIFPNAEFTAVEINDSAVRELRKIEGLKIYRESILNYTDTTKYDLVLSKGLLIHIHPDIIDIAYDELYDASKKYILICEYYNPALVEIPYRGKLEKLWKRDFCGDMLKRFSNLKLLDYGFVSKYDKYPQDDITWFLMEKE